jgi:nitrogen fixation protein NifU and related proteins
MKTPDGHGKQSSDCGDTMEVFLREKEGRIVKVGFNIHGCNFTLDCARAAGELVEGKTIKDARQAVTPEQIEKHLGGLPEHNRHCAEMASEVMIEALAEVVVHSQEPWKKLYRNF